MFITFVEDTPAPKKPPLCNTAMIILNVVVCWKTLNSPHFQQILDQYGFIPARHLGVGVVTAIFLHSSWTQLVANMTFLYMFGKGVEQRYGKTRYLAAYLLCSLAGEAAHWYFHPQSLLPLIGASRAVTGLGVIYLILYPWGKMKWIFQFFGVPLFEIPSRTLYVMGLWIGVLAALSYLPWSKLAHAVAALSKLGGSVFTINPTAGIAWDAHLGAMAMGVAIHFYFLVKKK